MGTSAAEEGREAAGGNLLRPRFFRARSALTDDEVDGEKLVNDALDILVEGIMGFQDVLGREANGHTRCVPDSDWTHL